MQITALQQLARLEVDFMQAAMSVPEAAALAQLPMLRALGLRNLATPLPLQLSRLALLSELRVAHCQLSDEAPWERLPHAVHPILASLTRLTRLDMQSVGNVSGSPAGLERLTSLQSLSLVDMEDWQYKRPPRPLPSGRWLAGITHLDLSWHAVKGRASTMMQQLAALQVLTVRDVQVGRQGSSSMPRTPGPDPYWRWFYKWAAKHPGLRRLAISPSPYLFDRGGYSAGIEYLQDACPGLQITEFHCPRRSNHRRRRY